MQGFQVASTYNSVSRLSHSIAALKLFLVTLFLVGCGGAEVESYKDVAISSPQVTTKRIDEALERVLINRKLSDELHGAWQVMHGVLAYGDNFPISTASGEQNALEYLLNGGQLDGWTLEPGSEFVNSSIGLRAILEPGHFIGQGHADQWLAIIAQANLPLETTIKVGERRFSVGDFLAQVKWDVPTNMEQEWSWTLIAVTHYLNSDSRWTASDGHTWSVEKLIEEEAAQALESSTCGGTHRLIGMSMALNRRRDENAPMTGAWANAESLVQQAVSLARQYQNSDGSFSSNYFARSGISADNAKILSTTGHTLEFLAITLPKDQLREPWMVRSVNRLCQLLEDSEHLPLECGALYHAVHGLAVYRKRVGLGDSNQSE